MDPYTLGPKPYITLERNLIKGTLGIHEGLGLGRSGLGFRYVGLVKGEALGLLGSRV